MSELKYIVMFYHGIVNIVNDRRVLLVFVVFLTFSFLFI